MTLYEQLLDTADKQNIIVREKPLCNNDGLIYGNRIAIRRDLPTAKEKTCVLAEELGHYYTTAGDIIDLHDANNQKQEQRARVWGYDQLIGLSGLIRTFEHGCRNRYEMAEDLDITEEYLEQALKYYHSKYGVCAVYRQYVIYFKPYFSIAKIFND